MQAGQMGTELAHVTSNEPFELEGGGGSLR